MASLTSPPLSLPLDFTDPAYYRPQGRGMKPDNGTYLALARMEAIKGDPEAALQRVRR